MGSSIKRWYRDERHRKLGEFPNSSHRYPFHTFKSIFFFIKYLSLHRMHTYPTTFKQTKKALHIPHWQYVTKTSVRKVMFHWDTLNPWTILRGLSKVEDSQDVHPENWLISVCFYGLQWNSTAILFRSPWGLSKAVSTSSYIVYGSHDAWNWL